MKRRTCFVCSACCFYCPDAYASAIEETYGISASDAGVEHVSCSECCYNSGECVDCLFFGCPECPEVS